MRAWPSRRLKFGRARAGAFTIAQIMQDYYPSGNAVLTYVPTATGRVRQRGYDQAALIAQAYARAADGHA